MRDPLDIPVEEEGVDIGLIVSMLTALGIIVLTILSLGGVLPRFAVIQTTSMVPTLVPGDVVMIVKVDPRLISEGDIIAFNYVCSNVSEKGTPIEPRPVPITVHRVIEKLEVNGHIYFRTKGDHNPVPDPWIVPASGVLGRAEKVASLGRFGLVLTTPFGKALVVIIMLSSLTLLASAIWNYNRGLREDLEHYI